MKTAPVFSSNMVLQRGKNVRIFGQCDADENIRVSIPELQIGTEALVSNGSWTAVLPPMEAHSSVTVEVSSESGSIIFMNVAIGEVWLAGGQSCKTTKTVRRLLPNVRTRMCAFTTRQSAR